MESPPCETEPTRQLVSRAELILVVCTFVGGKLSRPREDLTFSSNAEWPASEAASVAIRGQLLDRAAQTYGVVD